jgi:hypothetical protein
MRHERAWVAAIAVALAAGCGSSDDQPVSLLEGLRVIAIQASPPEIAPGEQTQVTALVVDDPGLPAPTVTWQACLRAPLPGQSVNPDCVTQTTADFLVPLGAGPTVTVTMPSVPRESLGLPDSTGGVYLTLVARVVGARDRVDATYRLRTAGAPPPNHNPKLASVLVGRAPAAADTPLAEDAPLVVHAGDRLRLRSTFTPDSAERYVVPAAGSDGGSGRETTELLTTSWFCTGGELSVPKTSDAQPETELRLDHAPPAGTVLDLYAVGRDERGGTDVVHRTLVVQ